MNRDFVEMLCALSETGAEFIIVGAHALAAHGHPRATGDLDIWIRPGAENAGRVLRALRKFGAPLLDLTQSDLIRPGTVFQIGTAPSRIDILTAITGVSWEQAWPRRLTVQIEGLEVAVLGREDLVANKRATGRARDRADLILLSEQEE
ncbi:MAG: hypothetical protein DMG10_12670 [Acidobacteria bacterium]|nr:MAG: hypothetical protein DMG10_12670 [Acidobacteriota bacterium]